MTYDTCDQPVLFNLIVYVYYNICNMCYEYALAALGRRVIINSKITVLYYYIRTINAFPERRLLRAMVLVIVLREGARYTYIICTKSIIHVNQIVTIIKKI